MKKYEVMYIIRPNVEEEARKALIEEMNAVFASKNSTVDNVKEMGMRELAYEIKDYTKGLYVVIDTHTTPEAIAEFERLSRINPSVLRHLTLRRD